MHFDAGGIPTARHKVGSLKHNVQESFTPAVEYLEYPPVWGLFKPEAEI